MVKLSLRTLEMNELQAVSFQGERENFKIAPLPSFSDWTSLSVLQQKQKIGQYCPLQDYHQLWRLLEGRTLVRKKKNALEITYIISKMEIQMVNYVHSIHFVIPFNFQTIILRCNRSSLSEDDKNQVYLFHCAFAHIPQFLTWEMVQLQVIYISVLTHNVFIPWALGPDSTLMVR